MQTCKYPANQTLHKYAACTSWCKHTLLPLLLLVVVVRIYVRRRRVCKKHTADNNNIHVAGSAAAIWMAASLSSLHMHTRPFILISGMCVLVMIIMERRRLSIRNAGCTRLDQVGLHACAYTTGAARTRRDMEIESFSSCFLRMHNRFLHQV